MKCGRWVLLFLAGVLTFTASIAQAKPLLLAGDEKAVWVVRKEEPDTYNVFSKPTDAEWQTCVMGMRGNPAAVTAINGQLHLIEANPVNYLVFNPPSGSFTAGRKPDDHRWPEDTELITLCPAGKITKTNATALLALVGRDIFSSKTQPATAKTELSLPDSLSAKRLIHLGLFIKQGNEWSHLGAYPEPLSAAVNGQIIAASKEDKLFVMLTDPAGKANRFLSYSAGQWRELPMAGLETSLTPRSMLVLRKQLVVFLTNSTDKASEKNYISLYKTVWDESRQEFSVREISFEGKPKTWPVTQLPLAARLGDRIALVWLEDETIRYAKCSLDGEILNISDVKGKVSDGAGERIFQGFILALAIVIFLLFLTRPARAYEPFTLPEPIRPANPIKRIAAMLIDLFPWSMLGWFLFVYTQNETPEETARLLQEIFAERQAPVEYAYAAITTMALFTAYCIIMELKFGATFGKIIFKLRVTANEGKRPDIRSVILRNLLRIIEIWTIVIIAVPLLVIFTRNRQRLGDMIAQTTVIDARNLPAPPIPEPSEKEPPTPDDEQSQYENNNDKERDPS